MVGLEETEETEKSPDVIVNKTDLNYYNDLIYTMKVTAILLSILCKVSSLEPKLCKNCKYFIPHVRDIKFSKCSLFPKLQEDNYALINGVEYDIPVEYFHCSIARNYNMCGKKGKKYEEK